MTVGREIAIKKTIKTVLSDSTYQIAVDRRLNDEEMTEIKVYVGYIVDNINWNNVLEYIEATQWDNSLDIHEENRTREFLGDYFTYHVTLRFKKVKVTIIKKECSEQRDSLVQ